VYCGRWFEIPSVAMIHRGFVHSPIVHIPASDNYFTCECSLLEWSRGKLRLLRVRLLQLL
jgi:hypothetical protein